MSDSTMRMLAGEPLVHFTLIAALLFASHAWLRGGASDNAGRAEPTLRITGAQIQWLQQGFARQWHRPPTADETRALAADLLREQLLAREAQQLGLDADDTVVRRRLAQKMAFVLADTVRLADPPDDELRRYHAANDASFASSRRVSFEHVHFSATRRANPVVDARAALAVLARRAGDAARVGDAPLMGARFTAMDESAVASTFGADFARALFELPRGGWQGPIASAYGAHLVRVTGDEPSRQPEFAEVREQVLERWRDEQQRDAMRRHFAALLAKYPVAIDDAARPLIGIVDAAQLIPTTAAASGPGQ